MGYECNFSYGDLFLAAKKREMSTKEEEMFSILSHDERNLLVSVLAKEAGWETKNKTGSDGLLYVAFAPQFKEGDDVNPEGKEQGGVCA